MKIKSTITFTEQEYTTFNKTCMMLDDLVNTGEYREIFSEIIDIDLDDFYDAFATITNYVEEHRE